MKSTYNVNDHVYVTKLHEVCLGHAPKRIICSTILLIKMWGENKRRKSPTWFVSLPIWTWSANLCCQNKWDDTFKSVQRFRGKWTSAWWATQLLDFYENIADIKSMVSLHKETEFFPDGGPQNHLELLFLKMYFNIYIFFGPSMCIWETFTPSLTTYLPNTLKSVRSPKWYIRIKTFVNKGGGRGGGGVFASPTWQSDMTSNHWRPRTWLFSPIAASWSSSLSQILVSNEC